MTRRVSASPVFSNSKTSFSDAQCDTDGPVSASVFNEEESVENPWKVNLKSCNINIKFENFKGEKLFSKDVVTTKVVVPGFPALSGDAKTVKNSMIEHSGNTTTKKRKTKTRRCKRCRRVRYTMPFIRMNRPLTR